MCLASSRLYEAVESWADIGESVREQMAVGVERDVDRGVAELRLEELGMGAIVGKAIVVWSPLRRIRFL